MRVSILALAGALSVQLGCDKTPQTHPPTETDPATSAPTEANLLGTIALSFDTNDVAVFGDAAYLATEDGITLADLNATQVGIGWPSPSGGIDSIATDGQWIYAASREDMFRLDPSLGSAAPIDIGLAWTLAPLVFDPVTATVFGRDRTDELLYEVDFGNDVFVGTIDYTPDAEAGSTGSFGSHLAVDGETGVLYVLDAGELFTVDPTVTPAVIDTLDTPEPVESIAVDTASRRLFAGLAIAGTGSADLLAIDLDTHETVASVGLGNQIHHLTTDPTTGRVFVNVRVTTSWTTRIFALEGSDLSEVPWLLELEADPVATSSSIHALLSIETSSRKLAVVSSATQDGGQSRLDVYALP